MNKITIYLLASLLCFSGISSYSQVYNGQDDSIFYHTVERGQTVYSIATMYGVTIEDIYRLNPETRETLGTGVTLKIPQKKTVSQSVTPSDEEYQYHTIQPKETLYSVSNRYEIPATAIINANPGLSVETFQIGKTIRIPLHLRIEDLPQSEFRNVTKLINHRVTRQETLYSLTRQYNISAEELTKINPALRNGVKEGMTIRIPVQVDEPVSTAPVPVNEREVNALLIQRPVTERVDRMKVALLLPFMTEEVTPSSSTSRFIEYYEGMLLAIDSLRNRGLSMELSVFDTGNGTAKLSGILNQPALREANLIIGGVQNEQIAILAEFAKQHEINYVIPFTSRNDDVLSNSYVFQVNTPQSYLYAKAVQTGCDLFAGDHIILLNTLDKEDKAEFIQEFRTEMQQRNMDYSEITYRQETFQQDMDALLSRDRRNVIVPLSGTLEALNKFRSTLRSLQDNNSELTNKISLFGYPEWQTYTRECLDDFYELNTYIYTNFYADNLAYNISDFYRQYETWYSKTLINSFPKYGMLGFDTGMFFFGAIDRFGTHFENNLKQIHYTPLQTGFDFNRVNNWGGFINTNIFIVHYSKWDYSITRQEVR